jgi:DNA topoisomerase-3
VRQPDGKIGFEFEKRAPKPEAAKAAVKRRAAGK